VVVIFVVLKDKTLIGLIQKPGDNRIINNVEYFMIKGSVGAMCL